jgi:hypothetical protein
MAGYSETNNPTPYPLSGGVSGGAKQSSTQFQAQPNPELFKLTEENNNLRALLEQERHNTAHLTAILDLKDRQLGEYFELLKEAIAKK